MTTVAVEDAEAGKLFEVPRIEVTIDETDPDKLEVVFSGSIELDRTVAAEVAFFNSLVEGRELELDIGVRVLGRKVKHKADSEGYVKDVIATKSLGVTYVHFPPAD